MYTPEYVRVDFPSEVEVVGVQWSGSSVAALMPIQLLNFQFMAPEMQLCDDL